ncbi:MAG: hypothetical protein LBL63_07135 [Clostridiales Family XIII bacterium]|jgi:hypothetical protein|nr:hypothetical protein [Clostridiales Family XIII bacterium]
MNLLETISGGLEKAKLVFQELNSEGEVSGEGLECAAQFNPSSLRFETSASAQQVKGMMANMTDLPNQQKRQASIVLSAELVFDAVQNADAFHGDSLRLSSQDVISQVGAAFSGRGNKHYTVIQQTNFLIAAVVIPGTVVTFYWGSQSFFGQMKEVQARYVMFSPSGHPIRSKVSIRIQQAITSKKDVQYWDKAVTTMFADDATRASHEKSLLQQQSIINLSGY